MKEDNKKTNEPKLTVSTGEPEEVTTQVEAVAESLAELAGAPEQEQPSLQQLIRDNVSEEDAPVSRNNLSLRKILFGDFLMAEIVRRQIWLILLITLFFMAYIAQRYSYQKYMVEIDKMSVTLKDARFRALSSHSDLTEQSRQSKILDMLKANNDSLLQISDTPPFMIKVPEQ